MNNKLLFKRINFHRDIIISILVIILPFVFFLYSLVINHNDKIRAMFHKIGFINTKWHIDFIFWLISCRILTILIFSFWYITCIHKWRYFILIPLAVEVNKFLAFFYELGNNFHYYANYYSFFVSLPLIFILTILSHRLKFYSFRNSINMQINKEIDMLLNNVSNFKKEDYKKFKRKLIELRSDKKKYKRKVYLSKLIKLREEFLIG